MLSEPLTTNGHPRKQSRRYFRVLALDGGGVRGVCPAAYLTVLEQKVGAPLHRFFDLICGTSTGGIIALALAFEVPMEEVLALYRDRAEVLFRRRYPWLPRSLALLADSLYLSEPLHEELRRVLGNDTKLGEARKRLCVPAVNITTGRATVFKTRHDEEFDRDHKLEVWRIAAATAAAPVYFDPVQVPDCGVFVDGGLWANTPATVGILEGRRLGYDLNEIELLSIGTGAGTFHRSAKLGRRASRRLGRSASHGLVGWGTGLVSLSMHAQTDRAENFMHYLLGERHRRVQFRLPEGAFDLDAVEEVETLAQIALEEAKRSAREVRERFMDTEAASFLSIP